MAEKKEKNKPGYYESDIDGYPGFIQFPAPFMLSHARLWWKEAIEKIDGQTAKAWDYQIAEWNAARDLLVHHGEWAIKGVDITAAKGDQVPGAVAVFVLNSARDYIPPFLPVRSQQGIHGRI